MVPQWKPRAPESLNVLVSQTLNITSNDADAVLTLEMDEENLGIAVLITECIQQDFLGAISKYEPVPNALHVGYEETVRVLGPDPKMGPMFRLIKWARLQSTNQLHIIHIRDWHDPNDTEQDHVKAFGMHCVQNTPGAELVLGLGDEVEERPNEYYVNVTGFNDFQGTNLAELLATIQEKSKKPIRVGVVGVSTEAKVTFLLYELKTRLQLKNLATCSALTASTSRVQHFNALQLLHNLLGVKVTTSVSELTQWLLPEGNKRNSLLDSMIEISQTLYQSDSGSLSPNAVGRELIIEGLSDDTVLRPDDMRIINFIFRTNSRLILSRIGGGFSGALVFKVQAYDAMGHKLPTCVLKLGPTKNIATEMTNFEQVEEILGNNAPRVTSYIDLTERAGIRFAFASMIDDTVHTFEQVYKSDTAVDRIHGILTSLFEDILGRFTAASQWERIKLLDCYNFDGVGWAYFKGGSDTPDRVAERARNIMGIDGKSETIAFSKSVKLRNVALFLEADLPNIPRRYTEYHFVSYVHGDLNGNNILLDANNNIWLIDFFYTERTHVLKDISKIENDILYLYTTINTRQEFEEALKIVITLQNVIDLGVSLPPLVLQSPSILRAWSCIVLLRDIVKDLVKHDRHPYQAAVCGLRYTLHYLCMDGLSPWQYKLALAGACANAEVIKRKYEKEEGELIVYWINHKTLSTKGKLGITLLPGRIDRGRHLDSDLSTLKLLNTNILLGLCQEEELDASGVHNLPEAVQKHNMHYEVVPIRDQQVPSLEVMKKMVDKLVGWLNDGQNVVVFDIAGLGRCGTVASCVLVASEGMNPEEAIGIVRKARGTSRALERKCQEKMVFKFASAFNKSKNKHK